MMNKKSTILSLLFGMIVVLVSSSRVVAAERPAAEFVRDAQRLLAQELAPVKSRSEFDEILRYPSNASSAFHALSPGAQTRFMRSMRFSGAGLATFDYRDLQTELTASQIFSLLRVFGVENLTTEIPNLRVESVADQLVLDAYPLNIRCFCRDATCGPVSNTCVHKTGSICTDNC